MKICSGYPPHVSSCLGRKGTLKCLIRLVFLIVWAQASDQHVFIILPMPDAHITICVDLQDLKGSFSWEKSVPFLVHLQGFSMMSTRSPIVQVCSHCPQISYLLLAAVCSCHCFLMRSQLILAFWWTIKSTPKVNWPGMRFKFDGVEPRNMHG